MSTSSSSLIKVILSITLLTNKSASIIKLLYLLGWKWTQWIKLTLIQLFVILNECVLIWCFPFYPAYELWFKQILFELDSVRDIFIRGHVSHTLGFQRLIFYGFSKQSREITIISNVAKGGSLTRCLALEFFLSELISSFLFFLISSLCYFCMKRDTTFRERGWRDDSRRFHKQRSICWLLPAFWTDPRSEMSATCSKSTRGSKGSWWSSDCWSTSLEFWKRWRLWTSLISGEFRV